MGHEQRVRTQDSCISYSNKISTEFIQKSAVFSPIVSILLVPTLSSVILKRTFRGHQKNNSTIITGNSFAFHMGLGNYLGRTTSLFTSMPDSSEGASR